MSRLGGPGRVRCVVPRTGIGVLGIGEYAGLHRLREVQGGQVGRGGDADGMPRLGDDVGPGCDLRFKVTQDVAAGEGARIADREQQALLVGEIVFVGRHLAPLTGPDPRGGLDEQPLGHSQRCRGPLIRGHNGEAGGRPDLNSPEGSGVSLARKADVVGRFTVALGEDRHHHTTAWNPRIAPLAEVDFVSDPVGVILARAVAIVCVLSRCDGILEVDSLGICVVMETGDKVRQDVVINGVLVKPKLRPVRQVISVLICGFAGLARCRSGYVKVSGIGTPIRSKAWRCSLVGSVSISTVAWVPVNRTWLRVRVAR